MQWTTKEGTPRTRKIKFYKKTSSNPPCYFQLLLIDYVNVKEAKYIFFYQDDNGFSEIEDSSSSSSDNDVDDKDESDIDKNDDVENGRRPAQKNDTKKQVSEEESFSLQLQCYHKQWNIITLLLNVLDFVHYHYL